jgi:23S rRNA pseudouridine955/2504/2580 synthase
LESFASVRLITIEEDGDGQRIDNYLFKVLKGVPKSHVYRIVRSGEVRVNKGRVKINTRLVLGDVLRLPPVKVEERSVVSLGRAAAEQILESVVYEDEGMMVINKPAGMAVHGGSGVSAGVIETLRCALPKMKFLELVHRLDRQTSGCLMIAKKPSVLKALHEDLRGDGVDKRYYALVCGSWPKGQKLVNAPLYKQPGGGGDRIVRVDVEGKASRTEFSVLKAYKDYTFVEAKPLTGRTHQIRVHAQFVGCPLVGDDRYGDFSVNREVAKIYGLKRLFLHAHQLSFFSPIAGRRITVSAPMSEDLERMLARL